jgi:hypothetical protein
LFFLLFFASQIKLFVLLTFSFSFSNKTDRKLNLSFIWLDWDFLKWCTLFEEFHERCPEENFTFTWNIKHLLCSGFHKKNHLKFNNLTNQINTFCALQIFYHSIFWEIAVRKMGKTFFLGKYNSLLNPISCHLSFTLCLCVIYKLFFWQRYIIKKLWQL